MTGEPADGSYGRPVDERDCAGVPRFAARASHSRPTASSRCCGGWVAARDSPVEWVERHADTGKRLQAIGLAGHTSDDFTKLLADDVVRQSLSRPRQCWDNAVAESWFATLKNELIYRHSWPTRAAAQRAIFEFIEVFFNRQRLHSSLGHRSPAEYEAAKAQQPRTAQAAWQTCPSNRINSKARDFAQLPPHIAHSTN